jgi:hypothetical protein
LSDKHILRQIEKRLEFIERVLYRAIHLVPATKILILGDNMTPAFALTAGAPPITVTLVPLPPGSVFASPADLELTSDDPDVVIVEHPGDSTGTMFDVSTPATDTETEMHLDATGLAPNAVAGGAPVAIAGAILVTIAPAVSTAPPAQGIGINLDTPAAPAQAVPAAAVKGQNARAAARP